MLIGQFPGEQGLVASGMSAQFKVRFMPDSLGEYSDEICVQSQCTEPLIVKVIAKRPPPVLTCELIISSNQFGVAIGSHNVTIIDTYNHKIA